MKARKIPLKTLSMVDEFSPAQSPHVPFGYAAHIKAAIGYGGERGLTAADMTTAFTVLEGMKGGILLLSEPDYAWLLRRVQAMTWQMASRAAVQFIKDIEDAELVDLTEPQAMGEAA